ncbi:hypothetical protein U27_00343 [Candidatus Vecturithrix granuli]|uniref:Sulfotransferase n=1 Tax=Vecturithrix granuli TaxID=1499967 RepID=A0A081C791_VECG1|nr:hypothetical protein U27_00343 [Candidatus Vecturithrix granuli]
METKLIYIVGGGHSGSTLLDMLIGTAPEVVNLGEVYFFESYNYPGSDPKLYVVYSKMCACGEQFSDCSFWQAVNRKLPNRMHIIRYNTLAENVKITWNMASPLPTRYSFRVSTGDDATLFEAIESVLRETGETPLYLLDSSKDPRRLVRLTQLFGSDKLVVIHLIRDGRGYVNSYANTQKERVCVWGQKPQNFLICAIKWILFNWMTRRYIKKHKLQSLHISYDLFCQNPAQYINILNERLSIHIPENYLGALNSTRYHTIHGNLMKFKGITSITHDKSWRRELSWGKRVILTALLFPFNYIFTYHDDFSAEVEHIET